MSFLHQWRFQLSLQLQDPSPSLLFFVHFRLCFGQFHHRKLHRREDHRFPLLLFRWWNQLLSFHWTQRCELVSIFYFQCLATGRPYCCHRSQGKHVSVIWDRIFDVSRLRFFTYARHPKTFKWSVLGFLPQNFLKRVFSLSYLTRFFT